MAESAVFSLATRLRETGRISRADLPAALGDGCPRIETILDEIRDECAEMALARHKGDRNEFLSLDYAMLSKLLSDAASADREESEENAEGVRRLTQALGGHRPSRSLERESAAWPSVCAARGSSPSAKRSCTEWPRRRLPSAFPSPRPWGLTAEGCFS